MAKEDEKGKLQIKKFIRELGESHGNSTSRNLFSFFW